MESKTTIGMMIKELIIMNAVAITWYAVLTTLIIILLLMISRKRKREYIQKKEERINFFGIYQATYSPNDDAFLKELWAENQRLEGENKAFKKTLKRVPLLERLSVLALFLGVFIGLYLSMVNKKKE